LPLSRADGIGPPVDWPDGSPANTHTAPPQEFTGIGRSIARRPSSQILNNRYGLFGDQERSNQAVAEQQVFELQGQVAGPAKSDPWCEINWFIIGRRFDPCRTQGQAIKSKERRHHI
jgi:hypothetical protein